MFAPNAPRVIPPFWLWRPAYNLPALLAGILLALVVLLLSSIQVFSFENTRRPKMARTAFSRRAIDGPCAVM